MVALNFPNIYRYPDIFILTDSFLSEMPIRNSIVVCNVQIHFTITYHLFNAKRYEF
jgi:hypothetical protein